MVRPEIIIAVKNVRASADWYCRLLNATPQHGGDTFEILAGPDNNVILCLHQWGAHGHPTMLRPDPLPGNGLILYFRVSDVKACWENALQLKAVVEEPPHLNENAGREDFSLRDPDGYYVSVSAE